MKQITLEHIIDLDYAANEAYKSLRTNLKFCGTKVRVILLTSSTPDEGKSTVSFNLARALAEDGRKVVYLDADMRKSVSVGRLGANAGPGVSIKGLSHYLSGQETIDQILYQTNLEGLAMITAGPVTPNPTELLGNTYMEQLLETLREQFDYIIVDAPPLGSVIDAAILGRICDGAILVVEDNRISYHLAQNMVKQLKQADCKVLGAILNKVDMDKGGYYQGYYKKYYGEYHKYYEYEASDQK